MTEQKKAEPALTNKAITLAVGEARDIVEEESTKVLLHLYSSFI